MDAGQIGCESRPRGCVRLGLIGCGRAAELLYLPALANVPQVDLVAVADPIPSRRELIASALPSCAAFDSAEAMVLGTDVQAAVVATPPATHVAAARPVLAAGLPVLIEKPLALSLTEAHQLETLGPAAERAVMVGFNRREWEPLLRLREVLRRVTATGPPSARLLMTSDVAAWSPIGGVEDPLDDLGSHQIDLLRFLFGAEPVTVAASRSGDGGVRMDVRLESGLVAECFSAQSTRSRERIELRVGQRRYEVRMGSDRIEPAAGPRRDLLDLCDRMRLRLTRGRSSLRQSYEHQLRRFAERVLNGTPHSPGLADGMAVLRTVEAARRSLASGGKEIAIA